MSKKVKETPREIVKERIIQVKDDIAIEELKREFGQYKKGVKNWVLFSIFSVLSCILLWTHFAFSNWEWYLNHEKNLGITLLLNLTIVVALLNITLKTKWLYLISIICAVLTALFTLI